MIDPREWLDQAACAPRNRAHDLDWYSTDKDEKYAARAVCMNSCPVRRECLQDALDKKDIWGIHGGVDDSVVRRTLSVDSNGDPTVRTRLPRCPFCLSRQLDISGVKTRDGYATECLNCGLAWNMATIPAKLRKKKNAK